MSTAAEQAADAVFPLGVTADTTGDAATEPDGIFVDDLTAGSVRYKIPLRWKGRFCDVKASGGNLGIAFGDSTVTAALTTKSTVAAELITFKAGSCWEVSDGETLSRRVPASATHFAIIGAAAAGKVRIASTTGKGDRAA